MMHWNIINQKSQPIGLDIGSHCIKMIQLADNNGQIKVMAAEQTHIAPKIRDNEHDKAEFIVSSVKKMLHNRNFQSRKVVSCVPNDKLRVTRVRVQDANPEAIEQALRKEVAQRFGLDPDKDAIEYMPAGSILHSDEVKDELILFAVDSDTITNHINMLDQIGLKPVAIDTIPCALFRSFQRLSKRQEDEERTVVFVDVGRKFTTVVFGRERNISFVKQIPIGGEDFDREVASKLGVEVPEAGMLREKLKCRVTAREQTKPDVESPAITDESMLDPSTRQVIVDEVTAVAKKLAREISLCFRYYTVTFRGRRVERAIFTGGEAYEPVLLNVLRRQLAVEIVVAQPLKGFDMAAVNFASDRRGWLCEWAVAVGLSLRGWRGISEN